MAHHYRYGDRYQELLLPTCMADWLDENHLAWFVIRTVAKLDTTALHARHPNDGVGRPAFDPDIMLAVILYGYATGIRFSRRIEAACRTDAAFKVITGGQVPDHCTIARFIVDHEEAMVGLFVSGLGLCADAGMIDLSWVAVDGTKMAADAALRANRSAEWIRTQVTAAMAATKAAEKAEAAGAPGVLPRSAGQIRGAQAQLDRLKAAQAVVDAEEAAQAQRAAAKTERAAAEAAEGRHVPGAKPKDPATALARAEIDLAIAEARLATKTKAREAAAAAGTPIGPEGHWITAAQEARDRAVLVLERARAAAAAAPAPEPCKANVTDADSRVMMTRKGYLQGYNAQAVVGANQVVLASSVSNCACDAPLMAPMVTLTRNNLSKSGIDDTVKGWLLDAGYWSEANAKVITDAKVLIATTKDYKQRRAARQLGTTAGDPPEGASQLEAMEHRLRTPEGAALYAKRSYTVEPVFGNTKQNRGYDRFRRRGIKAANAEWTLIGLVNNLGKLFKSQASSSPAIS